MKVVRPPIVRRLMVLLTIDTTFRTQMPVQRVHARKRLLTPFASVRTDVEMERLVPLAIVLTRKALFASWPLALERAFLVMRSHMTS